MFRITELSIAAVSVVCLGLFGCGGDGDGSSGGAVSGGSGKVVSCNVKTSQAGYEAESCTEVPESSPAAEPFKQACGNQSVAGVTTTTVGSGCPAAQKKCTIGEQTVYYYGEAAKYAQCADVGNDSGSSNLKSARRPLMPRVSRLVATCQAGLLEQAAQFLRRNVLMIKQSHIFTIPMI